MNTTRGEVAKDHLSKTIRVVFLAAVVFTALAHGAVEPWSVFVFEGIIVVILLLWSVKVAADRRWSLNVPSIFFPVASLIAVALVQSVALTDSSGRWMSLSKNVESTRAAVIVLIFLFISFLIATNFFDTRQRLSAVAQFLVIYGLAMAVFALVQHFTWNGSFYWLRHTEMTSPFGPFANHNHFAGYTELLIPLAVALVITRATNGQAPAGQTSSESFFSSRGWVWRDTFTMIRANPVLGVGFGAYETAFSMYTKSDGSLRVPQSHNDYLQIVADCGIVGGL